MKLKSKIGIKRPSCGRHLPKDCMMELISWVLIDFLSMDLVFLLEVKLSLSE
jgi:hypothetical protein